MVLQKVVCSRPVWCFKWKLFYYSYFVRIRSTRVSYVILSEPKEQRHFFGKELADTVATHQRCRRGTGGRLNAA